MAPRGTRRTAAIAAACSVVIGAPAPARAADTLPYSRRTHTYSGYSTAARGDTRTVGMAGATIGLADTFIAASDNPAGFGMTMNNGDDNVSYNRIFDANVQSPDSPINVGNAGVAIQLYPWAVSLGYLSSYNEGQDYVLASAPSAPETRNQVFQPSVSTHELRLGVARAFGKTNAFSLGLDVVMGQGKRTLDYPAGDNPAVADHSYALGATLGAMIKLPRHFTLGLSLAPPTSYSGSEQATPPVEHLFQRIDVPGRLGLGVGYIPNRFIRSDVSLVAVDRTPEAALLRDDSTRVGSRVTLQPKAGLAYIFMDFAELRGTAFTGTYYEVSRIDGASNRFHYTGGLEFKAWVFRLGWGADFASHYRNYLVGFGVDVFRIMEKIDLIPKPNRPPPAGAFPSPMGLSDAGLARPLVEHWTPDQGQKKNPIEIGLELPKKVEEKVEKTGRKIKEIIVPDVRPNAKPAAQPTSTPPRD